MSTSTSESEVEKTDSEDSKNESIDETFNNESEESDNSVQEDEEEFNDEKMVEDSMELSNNKKQDVPKARRKEQSSQENKITKDPEPIPLLSRPNAANQFRDYYMSQITKAFGEDLDKIRKEQNLDSNRLEILIDSLESGINIFSDVEKELALLSYNNK
ncbi:980_t:CDS:2 [Scutellospora calospora]|uniref:980_t:CDS:1 n=1 Tax=Scutellospora calospora TaxID=85575 RepID=A0ACA9JU36_9GLOM|nr:980_t:CDS:2 [Scutellospora calospora]